MTELDNDKTGKVAWFDSRKGIGFIERDNGDKDLFIHWSNVTMEGFKTLKPGQVVQFDIGENHRGEQAENVVVLSEPESEPTSEE